MQATNTTNEKFQRQYYIDALRVFAVFLLIVFHTAQVFVTWESWNIFNETTTIFANLLSSFIGTWHMQLFMLLAGASTWFALRKRTGYEYRAERYIRILIPYIFGTLLLCPPLGVVKKQLPDFIMCFIVTRYEV
jgi:surface polysaccharide O-acyltransferase-like enzyme